MITRNFQKTCCTRTILCSAQVNLVCVSCASRLQDKISGYIKDENLVLYIKSLPLATQHWWMHTQRYGVNSIWLRLIHTRQQVDYTVPCCVSMLWLANEYLPSANHRSITSWLSVVYLLTWVWHSLVTSTHEDLGAEVQKFNDTVVVNILVPIKKGFST